MNRLGRFLDNKHLRYIWRSGVEAIKIGFRVCSSAFFFILLRMAGEISREEAREIIKDFFEAGL